MKFEAVAYSDRGVVKQSNQDSVCIDIASTVDGDVAMLVVADGMGGLEHGELASATVVREMSKWFNQKLPSALKTMGSSIEGLENLVEGQWSGLVQDLNLKIMAYSSKNQMNMGTTMTAMLAMGGRFTIAHVGDTRIYEITSESAKQLTHDQTFVQREIDAGHLTEEAARTHPQRNVLLQCIGASKEVAPDISHHNLVQEATYLVCSDGFRHVLNEEELVSIFGNEDFWGDYPSSEMRIDEVRKKLSRVVEDVISRGETDNLSAAVMHAMPEKLR